VRRSDHNSHGDRDRHGSAPDHSHPSGREWWHRRPGHVSAGHAVLDTWSHQSQTTDSLGSDDVAEGTLQSMRIVLFHLGLCHGRRAYNAIVWYSPSTASTSTPAAASTTVRGEYHG